MNERIRELQSKSYLMCKQIVDDDGHVVVTPDQWFDKFAELLVRECMKEIKDMIVDESELLYPNNKQTTECVNNRLMDAHDNISELFGVE